MSEATNIKQYSVKLEPDKDGFYKVTVHVYHDDAIEARTNAIRLLEETIDDLILQGFKVLE